MTETADSGPIRLLGDIKEQVYFKNDTFVKSSLLNGVICPWHTEEPKWKSGSRKCYLLSSPKSYWANEGMTY